MYQLVYFFSYFIHSFRLYIVVCFFFTLAKQETYCPKFKIISFGRDLLFDCTCVVVCLFLVPMNGFRRDYCRIFSSCSRIHFCRAPFFPSAAYSKNFTLWRYLDFVSWFISCSAMTFNHLRSVNIFVLIPPEAFAVCFFLWYACS